MMSSLGEDTRAVSLHSQLHPLLHPAVLAMWRCARRLAVARFCKTAVAGVVRQTGATPAFCQLRRQSLLLAPVVAVGVTPVCHRNLPYRKENSCGPIFSH